MRAGDRQRPLLPVEVCSPHTGKSLKCWSLIDTGADDTVFPDSFAKALGLDLKDGEKEGSWGVGGPCTEYKHSLILKTDADLHSLVFPVQHIGFLEGLHIPLLGVDSFLSFFGVHMDYARQEFTLTPNGRCEGLPHDGKGT